MAPELTLFLILLSALTLLVGSFFQTLYVYRRGWKRGSVHEAERWLDALENVTPPNWQSLPVYDERLNKLQSEIANKMYVVAFKAALSAVREDIITNRREAIIKELSKNE